MHQLFGGKNECLLSCMALVVGAVAAVIVLRLSGMYIPVASFSKLGGVICALALCHHRYLYRAPDPKLAQIFGGLTVMISGAFLAGIIVHAGFRLRFPLTDDLLAAADRSIGLDAAAIVRAVAERPLLVRLFNAAYASIFPLCFITVIWLGLRGDVKRLWELVFGFVAGIELSAMIAIFFPAVANFAYSGLENLSGTKLPSGSGTYFLNAIHYLRESTNPALDVNKLEGIVTFPSFHMIMAIIVAYAFRGAKLWNVAISAWCLMVGISTVPIGGHYVIDLFGGALLWAGCLSISRYPIWRQFMMYRMRTKRYVRLYQTGKPQRRPAHISAR